VSRIEVFELIELDRDPSSGASDASGGAFLIVRATAVSTCSNRLFMTAGRRRNDHDGSVYIRLPERHKFLYASNNTQPRHIQSRGATNT
jgi:hypothetical protein